MTNYRDILKISYSYIGLLIIGFLLIFILLNHRNLKKSLKQIGITIIISGIITLGISWIIKNIIDWIVPDIYKVFIQVISSNLIKYMIIMSILVIVVGIILLISSKILNKNHH